MKGPFSPEEEELRRKKAAAEALQSTDVGPDWGLDLRPVDVKVGTPRISRRVDAKGTSTELVSPEQDAADMRSGELKDDWGLDLTKPDSYAHSSVPDVGPDERRQAVTAYVNQKFAGDQASPMKTPDNNPPGGGDAELDAARAEGRRRALGASLEDAGQMFAQAFTGNPVQGKGNSEQYQQLAEKPVQDLATRRKAVEESVLKKRELAVHEGELARKGVDDSADREVKKQELQQKADEAKAKMEDLRLTRQERADARREHEAFMLSMKSLGMDTMEAKRSHTLAEREVPGLHFAPGVEPSANATKTVQAALASKQDIEGSIDAIEKLFQQHGRKVVPDAAKAAVRSETMNVINKLRVLNKMGVPNGRDYEMLAKQLEEATGAGSFTKFDDYFLQQYRTLRNQLKRSVDATTKNYGYEPDDAGGGSSAAGPGGKPREAPGPNSLGASPPAAGGDAKARAKALLGL